MSALPNPTDPAELRVIWSVAGTDSGGGAGLAADQRAAEAMGLHLAPVVAAVTAQNTVAVPRVDAVPGAWLTAQMQALAADLPPRAVKTGLLASAEHAHAVAMQVDALRGVTAQVDALHTARGNRLPLVIDPVLRATTGTAFANAELLATYRAELLPRASLITPNRAEATALLGAAARGLSVPEQAAALRTLGAQAVCITGGDAADGALALDWIDTPQAQGWLALPRQATRHSHGTGCTFATLAAGALALGFTAADALVLAKMGTAAALHHGHALAGSAGAGPVRARAGFAREARWLPTLSANAPTAWQTAPTPTAVATAAPGLYAIVDSAARVAQVLAAGTRVDTVQLRIKRPAETAPDNAAWQATLQREIAAAQTSADAAGATLYINDHWREALALGARALHLGQEDLLALSAAEAALLRQAQARGLRLGLSSHSLWELARAHAWNPAYVACGPVWATTTKDMPWRPQGLHNLAWWAQVAGRPVVAIGGILEPAQLQACAAAGAQGGCVVRGLGQDPAATLPAWRAAWEAGLAHAGGGAPALPHPSLGDA